MINTVLNTASHLRGRVRVGARFMMGKEGLKIAPSARSSRGHDDFVFCQPKRRYVRCDNLCE